MTPFSVPTALVYMLFISCYGCNKSIVLLTLLFNQRLHAEK